MSFTLVIPDISCPRLTNQALLEISLVLFFLFVIAEMVGSVLSNSLSLLGDTASTVVDVGTYMCNIYGERAKNTYSFNSNSRVVLEVVIPGISMLSLVAVTVYISVDAVQVLLYPPVKDDVNVAFLYGFATANLLVDVICSGLFLLRADDVFVEGGSIPQLSLDTSLAMESDDEFTHADGDLQVTGLNPDGDEVTVAITSSNRRNGSDMDSCSSSGALMNLLSAVWGNFFNFAYCSCHCAHGANRPDPRNASGNRMDGNTVQEPPDDVHRKKNLNMVSAFAHILGDMLRTIAMFGAALISTLTGLDGDICDSWAALIVAATILTMCYSLGGDLWSAAVSIYYDEYSTSTDDRDGEGVGIGGRRRQYNHYSYGGIVLSHNNVSMACQSSGRSGGKTSSSCDRGGDFKTSPVGHQQQQQKQKYSRLANEEEVAELR